MTGGHSVPDSIEWGLEDSVGSLGRGVRVSAPGDGERVVEDVQVIQKIRMVGRDPVVVGGPLPV